MAEFELGAHMRTNVVERIEAAIARATTGSFAGQPHYLDLRYPWHGSDCGALDAPNYLPTGGTDAAGRRVERC